MPSIFDLLKVSPGQKDLPLTVPGAPESLVLLPIHRRKESAAIVKNLVGCIADKSS